MLETINKMIKNIGQAKSKPIWFCLCLTDCHIFIVKLREFLPNKKLQAALFFIAGSRTLILTALSIEIVRNL